MSEATLIVEDELPGEIQLEALLSPHLKAVSAKTVQEALAAVQQNPEISLVILDLFLSETPTEMPWFDKGLGLVGKIRELRPDMPVIVISSPFGEESARSAAKYGVAGVFSKYDDDLIKGIKELISKRRTQERRWPEPLGIQAPRLSQSAKIDQGYLAFSHHDDAFLGEIRDALLGRNLPTSSTTIVLRSPATPASFTSVQRDSREGRATRKPPLRQPEPLCPHVFISHASEDKEAVAEPLAAELRRHGYSVWLDRYVLRLGDSLRRTIDSGLAKCRFGVVILSPNFFKKEWPQRELDGLVALEAQDRRKRILPVWHHVTPADVSRYSPTLADRVAVSTDLGLGVVVSEIVGVIQAESGQAGLPAEMLAHNTAAPADQKASLPGR